MKSAISTRLIPIFFNGKDYNAAQKLKKIIDKNYLFIGDFFLGYKKNNNISNNNQNKY